MNKSFRAVLFQSALAVFALLIGVFVYLLDRHAENVYFLPHWLADINNGHGFLGTLGNYVPTFVHVYAFILLTMAIVFPVQQHRRYLVPVCVFWFSFDSLFEIAQLDAVAKVIAAYVPGWFEGIVFLENTATYFLTSTFDMLDLVSIALGAVAAYYTVLLVDNFYLDNLTNEEKQ